MSAPRTVCELVGGSGVISVRIVRDRVPDKIIGIMIGRKSGPNARAVYHMLDGDGHKFGEAASYEAAMAQFEKRCT